MHCIYQNLDNLDNIYIVSLLGIVVHRANISTKVLNNNKK